MNAFVIKLHKVSEFGNHQKRNFQENIFRAKVTEKNYEANFAS